MTSDGGGGGPVDAAKRYIAGFAPGIATVVVGHPFDTVKVTLQAYNTRTQKREYKNALHCTAQILSKEGVRGLYKGASPSFIGMAFESSLLFGFYSQTKQLLQGELQSSNRPQLQVIIPSAAYGGALISLILCPAELVKCRMQVQGTNTTISKGERFNGPFDCALKTVKSEGIKGIFRGGLATLFRESIGNSVFFSTYEFSRHYIHLQLNSNSSEVSYGSNLFIDVGIGIMTGGLSGIAYWSAVLPFDVAKTVIQTTTDVHSSRNPFWTLHSIYRRVGFRGCYAGLGPTLVRAFPANAAAIVTWELAVKILGLKHGL
ncbi:Mitochondrial arginine transporter BAC1 [Acorus calamus]|uniref:Mitochondrial arginine transporter BAC1 n=1 Tax=Acorus calamus TaxID=4465 RepID=A0AAV9DUF4_ACOCL|nr:Mitochondrial arginine transporter BAC1 [Acorus calamus]